MERFQSDDRICLSCLSLVFNELFLVCIFLRVGDEGAAAGYPLGFLGPGSSKNSRGAEGPPPSENNFMDPEPHPFLLREGVKLALFSDKVLERQKA